MRLDARTSIAVVGCLLSAACATSHPANPEAGTGCPYVYHSPDVGVCDPAGEAACQAWIQTVTPAGYTGRVYCELGTCQGPTICSLLAPLCDYETEVCVDDTPNRHCLCAVPAR